MRMIFHLMVMVLVLTGTAQAEPTIEELDAHAVAMYFTADADSPVSVKYIFKELQTLVPGMEEGEEAFVAPCVGRARAFGWDQYEVDAITGMNEIEFCRLIEAKRPWVRDEYARNVMEPYCNGGKMISLTAYGKRNQAERVAKAEGMGIHLAALAVWRFVGREIEWMCGGSG